MAWDDTTSKSKLQAGPVLKSTFGVAYVGTISFKTEADPDGWSVDSLEAWQDTLEPQWIAEWDTGPTQGVSGDAVAAYNNGFNNGLALGVNIKH